jgi:hypothetical protein
VVRLIIPGVVAGRARPRRGRGGGAASATTEWIVPPLDLGDVAARQLATEHHPFTPEAFEDETLEERAPTLVLAESWSAW